MKNKVYVPVSIKEKLPQARSYVVTVNSLGGIDTLFHQENGEFKNNHTDKECTIFYIEYWLKEVDLPSDYELEKEVEKYKDDYAKAWIDGFRYLKKLLFPILLLVTLVGCGSSNQHITNIDVDNDRIKLTYVRQYNGKLYYILKVDSSEFLCSTDGEISKIK